VKIKLSKIASVIVITMTSIIISCGGGSGSGNNIGVSYEGIWYNTSIDNYIEITNSEVLYRVCSINDGYRVSLKGKVDGDNFNILNTILKLSLSGDSLTISDSSSGSIVKYSRKSSIPVVCTGDAIEITLIAPTSVTEGLLTTFVVNFDYRLTSTNSGIVYFGFNTDVVNSFTLTENTFKIVNAETSSGSLTADTLPVLYNLPDSFMLYVNLSNDPHPTPWVALSSDFIPVTVTKSALFKTSNKSIIKNEQSSINRLCFMNTIAPCNIK